jgi:hypothetical protein
VGNKIGSDWTVECISPEGAIEVMASSGNVSLARAAYGEALKRRPGRVVRFMHGRQILTKRIGWQCERLHDEPAKCPCPACSAQLA